MYADITAQLSVCVETETPAKYDEVDDVISQLNEDVGQLMASSLSQTTELRDRLDESEEMRQRLEDRVCHGTRQLEEREDQLRTQGDQHSRQLQELKEQLESSRSAQINIQEPSPLLFGESEERTTTFQVNVS